MESNDKPIKYLVVDSSVLIKRAPIKDLTNTAYSVSGVVNEIRDESTRESLQVLPYDFKFKEPSSESVKFISNFSRKTGDYANLSVVDLDLIALTYQLCKENLTAEEFAQLKLEPVKNNQIQPTPDVNKLKLDKPVNIAGFYYPKKSETDEKEEKTNDSEEKETANEKSADNDVHEVKDNNNNQIDNPEIVNEEQTEENSNEEDQSEEENNNEDEEGWITPGNLDKMKQLSIVESELEQIDNLKFKVACMTSDFSMQNVLIQIGIPVLSVDGLLIKKARSYVLKCITCNRVTTNMEKIFCPYCSYKTLQRVIVTIDSDGNKIYRERRKPLNTKGLRYSLPMPDGGKHPKFPVISENQPRAQNYPARKALIKSNPLDPDYVCQSSPFATKDVYSRASRLGIKPNRFNKRK